MRAPRTSKSDRRTLRRLAALTIVGALFASCASTPRDLRAETAKLAPVLYPLDPAAPFAYRQWPGETSTFGDVIVETPVPLHGVAFEVWPDRAVLLVDVVPLWKQLRDSPRRRPRVHRWEMSVAQCPAIAGLYEAAVAARDHPGTHGQDLHAPWVTELFVHAEGRTTVHSAYEGLRPYTFWLGRVWQELDHCSRSIRPVTPWVRLHR